MMNSDGSMRHIPLISLLVGALVLAMAPQALACPDPCVIDGPNGGDYRVLEPDGWDGVSELPVLVWFHGWQRSGTGVMKNRRVGGVTRQNDVLLVAPNGIGKSWSMPVWQDRDRDELAFTRALLADVKRRWPIDENRVWVAGFSLGGSMAWYIACNMGSEIDAFFPVSGVFWRPHPDTCPDPADNLTHVHGTADTVMPLDGRKFGSGFNQGNVFQSASIFRAAQGFADLPDRQVLDGTRKCDIWSDAETGQSLELCLHPKGHFIPKDWVARSIDWANNLDATRHADGG